MYFVLRLGFDVIDKWKVSSEAIQFLLYFDLRLTLNYGQAMIGFTPSLLTFDYPTSLKSTAAAGYFRDILFLYMS